MTTALETILAVDQSTSPSEALVVRSASLKKVYIIEKLSHRESQAASGCFMP